MKKNIAVIMGDGVGPEVTKQSIKVLNAVGETFGHTFKYIYALMGAAAIEKTGNPLPAETLEICTGSDAILLGAIGDPKFDKDPNAKVRPEQGLLKLRKSLGLFANLRPVVSFPSLHHLSPLKRKGTENVDMIIYRELTGGIYFGEKGMNPEGTEARDVCVYSKTEIERIARLAFTSAQQRKKKITLVDKANVLETSRLWRRTVQEISPNYPDVSVDYMFVDNAAMQIIMNPQQFDVILTENMFGDILSDEASVISGSLGLLPSASLGNQYAMFEPIHGSYPQAAGRDIANPVGSILSAAMMLDYLNLPDEANFIREGVNWTLEHGFVTKDIDPVNFYFTSTIGDVVGDYITGKQCEQVKKENIELRKSTII